MNTMAFTAALLIFHAGILPKPQQSVPTPGYEVASIKPSANSGDKGVTINADPNGQLTTENTTVLDLIKAAYEVQDFQVVGLPAWARGDSYDIEAKPLAKSGPDQFAANLQALLADRFRLRLHREDRDAEVLTLTVAKSGLRLKPHGDAPRGIHSQSGVIDASGVTLAMFAQYLSRRLGRTVADKTGLTDLYDFRLEYTPDDMSNDKTAVAPAAHPSLYSALQNQLGLKLATGKGTQQLLVIDHVDRPTRN